MCEINCYLQFVCTGVTVSINTCVKIGSSVRIVKLQSTSIFEKKSQSCSK